MTPKVEAQCGHHDASSPLQAKRSGRPNVIVSQGARHESIRGYQNSPRGVREERQRERVGRLFSVPGHNNHPKDKNTTKGSCPSGLPLPSKCFVFDAKCNSLGLCPLKGGKRDVKGKGRTWGGVGHRLVHLSSRDYPD